MAKEARVNELIVKWGLYRLGEPEPDRYHVLSKDLYNVRNGIEGTPPYPPDLIDPDDEIMASVEHYYLTRGWMANGDYPEWQVDAMIIIYDTGKMIGATPRHNKSKPVTPVSAMQIAYQAKGVRDGKLDATRLGIPTSLTPRKPPTYF